MLRSYCGGALFGVGAGDGQVRVVFLHGWRRSSSDFRKMAGMLAVASVALDLPGFGATPEPPTGWSTLQYADRVGEVVQEIGAPLIVVGHSFGGRVAVRLAAKRPELVAGLVLTGIPLLRPDTGARAKTDRAYRFARWLNRRHIVSDQRLEKERRKRGSADYRAAEGVMREVLVKAVNEDYKDALGELSCPVELVWADDDTEVPLSVAEAAAEKVTGARLTVVSGAGHLLPLTAPGVLVEAVERLLQ